MKNKLFGLSAIGIFAIVTVALAQKQGSDRTETLSGVNVTTFETKSGKVKVYLPDDMAAGDTISGTVVSTPSGSSETERKSNSSVLNGYVIDIGAQKSPVSGGVLMRLHLTGGAGTVQLILLDSKGKKISAVPLKVLPAAPAAGAIKLPLLGQTGNPIPVQGPFDGDSSNTKVSIGGIPANVIAESPRKVIVESPQDVTGPTRIQVAEKGESTSGAFRNLKIELTAPKTSLLKGESTELHVQVSGLQGITESIPIQIQNQSPSTVVLSGGDTQNIVIMPSQVQSGGGFSWNANLTGKAGGGFTITSKLVP